MRQGDRMENEGAGLAPLLLSICPFSIRRVCSRGSCVMSLFPGPEESVQECLWAHEWAPALHGRPRVKAVRQKRKRRNKETKQNLQTGLVPWTAAHSSLYVPFPLFSSLSATCSASWVILLWRQCITIITSSHLGVTVSSWPCLVSFTCPAIQSSRVHSVTK